MISEKMQAAFLDQINKELYSEYLYLSMKAYFTHHNLIGWMFKFKKNTLMLWVCMIMF